MSYLLCCLRNFAVVYSLVFFNTNFAWALDDLSNATLAGDNEKLQVLIVNGAEVNGYKGGMALYWAAVIGKYATVETLIAHGADVNVREPTNGFTPLHTAVSYSSDKPPSTNGERPPIDVILAQNKLKFAELLIAHGADVNAKSKGGITPLQLAATKEMVDLLIKHGANVNAQTIGNDSSPLFYAIGNNLELINTLIAHGANVNYINFAGYTPLHLAVRSNQKELVKLLIKHGAVEIRDREGFTPLNIAVRNNDAELAGMLISKNEPHFNALSGDGLTNLHSAVIHRNEAMVELLLAKDNLIRNPNQYNLPQPIMATELARVAQVNTVDKYGRTPLALAIKNNDKALTELLIKHGAEK